MKVKIEMTGHGRGRVWIGDQEVTNIKSIAFRASAEKINTVTLVIQPGELTIDGEIRVYATGATAYAGGK